MKFEIIKSGVRGTTPKETLLIQAWGTNAIRVRASKRNTLKNTIDALKMMDTAANVTEGEEFISVKNGLLTCRVYPTGYLEFYKGEECVLKEYSRDDTQKNGHSTPIAYAARKYEAVEGGCRIQARFEGKKGEKIFGMGQYQQEYADLKGCIVELRQRNSQISIPFYLSNFGYGFLWNNASIGEAMFGEIIRNLQRNAQNVSIIWLLQGILPKK